MTRITIILVLGLALVAIMLYRRKKTAQQRKKFIYKILISLLAVTLTYLTLTGKMHFLAAIGAAVIPFLSRLLPLVKYIPLLRNLYQTRKATKKPESGQTSKVETSLLVMTLDHDTGQMDGTILSGTFAEKKLTDLSHEQLIQLYRIAKANHPDSIAVLEAYLDREIGDNWQQHDEQATDNQKQPINHQEMSVSEAYDILGLAQGANREEIINAHRKLMQKVHPDRGGSNYLAAKLNAAKDLLLKSL